MKKLIFSAGKINSLILGKKSNLIWSLI